MNGDTGSRTRMPYWMRISSGLGGGVIIAWIGIWVFTSITTMEREHVRMMTRQDRLIGSMAKAQEAILRQTIRTEVMIQLQESNGNVEYSRIMNKLINDLEEMFVEGSGEHYVTPILPPDLYPNMPMQHQQYDYKKGFK